MKAGSYGYLNLATSRTSALSVSGWYAAMGLKWPSPVWPVIIMSHRNVRTSA